MGASATSAGAAVVTIGNAATASITFAGVEFTTSGLQLFTADAYSITGADSTFGSSNDNITFADGGADGGITLADIADLTITTEIGGTGGGNIAVNIPIAGTAGDGDDATDVTMTAGSGTISVEDITTDINDVQLTSTGGISLDGTITTATDSDETGNESGVVTLTGPVTLAGNTTIDTDSASNNGAVTLTSTVDGGNTLTITSGSGAVQFGGNVGATTAISDLTVNSTGGTGAITFSGNVGASATSAGAAVVTIGNAATASITFAGVEFTTSGLQLFTADAYSITGADSTFGSSNDNITFADGGADGGITLADIADLTITTEIGGTGGGNIAVNIPIAGTAGDGDDATDVTMTAGSGTISVEDITTDINDVQLTSTGGISLDGTITTATDSDETGNESGVVTLTGPVTLAANITIDTDSASNNGACLLYTSDAADE